MIFFLMTLHICLLCWRVQSWIPDSRYGLGSAEQWGKISSLEVQAALLVQPRVLLATFATGSPGWLLSLLSVRTFLSLSVQCYFSARPFCVQTYIYIYIHTFHYLLIFIIIIYKLFIIHIVNCSGLLSIYLYFCRYL